MLKLCVFDLDGTLNQTQLYAVEAVRLALKDMGITDKSDAYIRSMFGASPHDYVRIYFPDGTEETFSAFLRLEQKYEDCLMQKYAKPFEGVENSLRNLRKYGCRLAVCSNASLRYIRLVLDTIGLTGYFDEFQPLVKGENKVASLRCLLQRTKPDSAVMVGDRIFDREAAAENRIPFVGCRYGYSPEEVSGADREVSHASELYDAVVSLL